MCFLLLALATVSSIHLARGNRPRLMRQRLALLKTRARAARTSPTKLGEAPSIAGVPAWCATRNISIPSTSKMESWTLWHFGPGCHPNVHVDLNTARYQPALGWMAARQGRREHVRGPIWARSS